MGVARIGKRLNSKTQKVEKQITKKQQVQPQKPKPIRKTTEVKEVKPKPTTKQKIIPLRKKGEPKGQSIQDMFDGKKVITSEDPIIYRMADYADLQAISSVDLVTKLPELLPKHLKEVTVEQAKLADKVNLASYLTLKRRIEGGQQ